jgi:hypothetical protein
MRSLVRPAALINAHFDLLSPPQRELAQQLQQAVQRAAPSLQPVLKWGNLVFMHQGRHAIAIVVQPNHVRLQLFNGAALAGQFTALEGGGRGASGARYVRFRYGQPVDTALVASLVEASLAEME